MFLELWLTLLEQKKPLGMCGYKGNSLFSLKTMWWHMLNGQPWPPAALALQAWINADVVMLSSITHRHTVAHKHLLKPGLMLERESFELIKCHSLGLGSAFPWSVTCISFLGDSAWGLGCHHRDLGHGLVLFLAQCGQFSCISSPLKADFLCCP